MCLPANDLRRTEKSWRPRQRTDGCRVRLSGFLEFQRFHSNDFVSCISFSLIWPVIISDTQIYGTNRTAVMDILDAFRGQCEWRAQLLIIASHH